MGTMIQIRHVPDKIHRKLKAKAALEGVSLSDYLLREVSAIAERPSVEDLRQRISSRSSVKTTQSMAKAVRSERSSR